ncbi:MAG: NADH-quinone oxidoreductase subunit N [Opitutus sp.]|nr:NADH-quinone oxidoreductase subunit N [Opitutus sp.]
MMPNYSQLGLALLPELSLVFGALLVIGYDLAFGRKAALEDRCRASAALGSIAAVLASWHVMRFGFAGAVFGGVLTFDALALMTRLGVLLLALLTLATLPALRVQRNPAEYVAVLLFATTGFLVMAAAQQLLLVFVAIELASLSLYVLAGFDKTRPESAEAGLKYFLFGGMAAAFLLFGFSLLYGLTGSIELPKISAALQAGGNAPLLYVALAMIVVAFGFKAAAAPFHLWAPDVYQGAPPSSAALIASASKLAGVAVFARLFWHGLAGVGGTFAAPLDSPGWLTLLAILAGGSLLLGNLAALAQTSVRRLLAYSAIGHAGVMLIGVMVAGRSGVAPLFYYVLTYGLATVGAFGVIGVVERHTGRCDTLADLAGLHRRSPVLALCLLVYLLSLAGVPPLAGFFGKFSVFAGALQVGGMASSVGALTLLAIALSAVALYYYLLVLKAAWVSAPPPDSSRIVVRLDALPLVVAAGLLLVLGAFPHVVLRMFLIG